MVTLGSASACPCSASVKASCLTVLGWAQRMLSYTVCPYLESRRRDLLGQIREQQEVVHLSQHTHQGSIKVDPQQTLGAVVLPAVVWDQGSSRPQSGTTGQAHLP